MDPNLEGFWLADASSFEGCGEEGELSEEEEEEPEQVSQNRLSPGNFF